MNLQSIESGIWDIWVEGNYYRAGTMLAAAQKHQPDEISYVLFLGLAYVLQGKPEQAQETWQPALETDEGLSTLVAILLNEAERQEQMGAWNLASRVRQQIRLTDGNNTNNLLRLVRLLLHQEMIDECDAVVVELTNALTADPLTIQSDNDTETAQTEQDSPLDPILLLETVRHLLNQTPETASVAELVWAILPSITHPQPWLELLQPYIDILDRQLLPKLAGRYAEICLALDPDNLVLLRSAFHFRELNREYSQATVLAEQLLSKSHSLLDKTLSHTMLLKISLWMGRDWDVVASMMQTQMEMLETLLATPEATHPINLLHIEILAKTLFLQPYFGDTPRAHHDLRRRIGEFLEPRLRELLLEQQSPYVPYPDKAISPERILSGRSRKLRIGYIGYYLRQHSVGWIARWLFAHHDHDRFEIYTYFIKQTRLDGFSRDCFASFSDQWRTLDGNTVEIAQAIQADEIDILVDLDSLTSKDTYAVMALKPAPVQVTWLGFDAAGLSTIDYFIADSYVLPDNAQDYYSEKIWRLPQTYVAVRGFEVGFPTYRREDLDIPLDATVYYSNQTSLKRHPDMVRVQMRILKQVPHSYFLIKNWGDTETIQTFFGDIAEAEGVSRDRLRFLPLAPTESLHRGNLMALADVVLDSYPYGGATTTLETLWVGLPLVTKVGEQFPARNSYTMMMNAGITEGIAWNDDEYIDWAVKFGTCKDLRRQIYLKLMRSRQTEPLWNARHFTHNLETAYQQMWSIYCQSN